MQEPIRIAQIVGKWIGGGVESVIMNYYRHMDRTKVQFDFLCDADSTDIPYEEIKNLGGRVIIIPPYQKVIKYHKELKKILKNNNYKIVHSHINTLSVFPLFAAKRAGVPIRIAHSHSTSNKKEIKRHIIKLLLRPFSKLFATNYMCCSELAGRWMFGNKAYDSGKVYILNNAIDLSKYKYNGDIRKAKRKELGINDKTLVIGHIGRFVETKNHKFLIDVFNEVHKKNENSILVLVGKGPLMDEIKDKVNNLGLTDSVKLLGQRNDANELYQVFDVFLLPSLYEGLGMVLIEAQCAGCYCLSSNKVPNKAKVSEIIKFLDLNQSAKEWAIEILNEKSKRIDHVKECKNSGYDIIVEVKKLESEYLKLWGG